MKPDFSKLDYSDIKQNLITFLKSQDKFNSYNFEGSTLNILLDILAYNTHYQSLYNNITFNEAFLDTAQKRSSVVSIAKNLGYTPESSRSATCAVEVLIDANSNGGLSSYTIPKNTAFKVNKDNSVYYFYNLNDAVYTPNTYNETTGLVETYTTGSIVLKEGTFKTVNFVINGSNPTQKITLRSANIDTNTISVRVQNSTSDSSGINDVWEEAKNMVMVDGSSKVYFLEEGPDENYRIYFGDGIIGQSLNEGNLVIITFLETNGEEANEIGVNDEEGARVFTSPSLPNTTVIVRTPSYGGSSRETTQSIKYKAPKAFSTQERAVTADDYSIVLQNDFSFIKSIKCWGGEDNTPPAYGKIFISIKPENRAALSNTEKNAILRSLTKNRAVVGIIPELVDPNLIYLIINCDAKVDIIKTNGSIESLKTKIISAINEYIQTNLDVFDADLIVNELENTIKNTDTSLLSVTVTPQLEYRLTPVYGTAVDYTINFQNEIVKSDSIDKPNIKSSRFNYYDYQNNIRLCRIYDNGSGKLYLAFENGNKEYSIGKFSNIDLTENAPEYIGSIDYETGILSLTKFKPQINEENNPFIKFFANVVDSDVFVNPDTILTIDSDDPNSVVINLTETAYRKPIK